MKLSKPAAFVLLAVVCSGCAAPDDAAPTRAEPLAPPALRPPWTQTFLDEAVLSAAQVRIEGPPGLLEHVVVVQDPENHDYVVRTTAEGLWIEAKLKPGGLGNAIHAQLDKLVIAADRSIVVLERPAEIPVSVEASGDAYFRRVKASEEQRGPSLRIVGEPVR